MSNNPISYTDPLGLSDLEVELNPVTIYASKPDWMRFGMDSKMDYAMAMGMAGWDDRPKPITNFEKQNWLTYNNPDEGTFWGRAFNADNYYGANEGGMTFPSFSTLWNNYPQDVNGSTAFWVGAVMRSLFSFLR